LTQFRQAFICVVLLIAATVIARTTACSPSPAQERRDESRVAKDAQPPAGAPQRIVSIAPNAAETIAALGAADQIVGVSDFCVFPKELTTLPHVGGIMNPDLERIATLDPDLIVLRGRLPSVESLCQHLGIDVYHDRTESYDDIFAGIERLGARLGRNEAAEALIGRMRGEIAEIRRRLADVEPLRVLLIVNRDSDAIRNVVTFGGGTFVDEVIRLAGGVNVFAESPVPYPQVTMEQIIAAQPEVIIEAIEESRMTDALRSKMLFQWSRLSALPAVRDDRIYIITEDYLLIPSPRVVDSIRLLARTLHGEVAGD